MSVRRGTSTGPARSTGLVVAATLLAACGADDRATGADGDAEATLTVFAASSLTAAFEDLAENFEADHDGVTVELGLAGSSDLAAQILQGAPADVFASADRANMEKLTAEDLQGSAPVDFATNTLEIAVPPGNPAGVESFGDLAGDLSLVVCAPVVPCGAATERVADAAGVELQPVSEEQSVTDALNKVVSGEADAGLVYVTDVAAAGDAVAGIPFPEARSVVNTYPIATVRDSAHPDLARQFVDLVTSDDGRRVLADHGFGTP
jgi:molybdate transport system substrate-binding protein